MRLSLKLPLAFGAVLLAMLLGVLFGVVALGASLTQ